MPKRPNIDTTKPLHFRLPKFGMKPTLCFYEVLGFREPKAGEFYLSGAIVETYEAPNDLATAFWVVRPTYRAHPVESFVSGEAI